MGLRSKAEYKYKVVILVAAIFVLAGPYFSYDNPSPLKDLLFARFSSKYDKQTFETAYSLLYSVYAIPNLVLSSVVGWLVGRLGPAKVFVTLGAMTLVGQAIVVVGCAIESFFTMYVGRMGLGIGFESLLTAQMPFLTQYYHNQETAILSASYTLGFLMEVVNCFFTAKIAVNIGVTAAFFLGFILTAVSFSLITTSVVLDWRVGKSLESRSSVQLSEETDAADPQNLQSHEGVFSQNIFKLPRLFWVFILVFSLTSNSTYGFTNIGASWLADKWYHSQPGSETKAGETIAIVWATACVTCALFGKFFNDYGFRSVGMIIAPLLVAICHVCMIYFESVLPLIGYGIALSIVFSAVLVSLQVVVPAPQLGIAYGVFFTLQNLSLVLTPIIVGFIKRETGSYSYSQIFLTGVALVSMVCGILTFVFDRKAGGKLYYGIKRPGPKEGISISSDYLLM